MDKMCDKNLIFACSSMPCSHKSHMIALVTVHDFIFYLSMISFTQLKTSQQWKRQHVQPLRVLTIQNTRAAIVASSGQSNIKVTLWVNYKLICWCLNLHKKVRYKSEKAFGLWPELHNSGIGVWIHNHSLWRTLDYCIHPPIPLIV